MLVEIACRCIASIEAVYGLSVIHAMYRPPGALLDTILLLNARDPTFCWVSNAAVHPDAPRVLHPILSMHQSSPSHQAGLKKIMRAGRGAV